MRRFLCLMVATLAVVGFLTACELPAGVVNSIAGASPQETAEGNIVLPEPKPTSPGPTVTANVLPDGYPASPEEVVKAFISLYPDEPDQMKKYLSPALIKKIPKGGPVALLKFNGVLTGFSIDSASVNPDPPGAVIGVRAEVGGGVKKRTLILVKSGDHWVIDAIRVPK